MDDALRILLVDESPDMGATLQQGLQQELEKVRVVHVRTHAEFERALEADYDVAVTAHRLAWSDGFKVYAGLKARSSDIPVLLLLDPAEQDIVVEAVRAGLDAYIIKNGNYVSRLAASIGLVFERRVQRRAAREAEAELHQLFDRVPVGLYRVTPEGAILEANTALVQVTGCSDRDTLLALHADVFFENHDSFDRWRARVEAQGDVHVYEGPARRIDGSGVWVRNSVRVVRDGEGGALYFEGAIEDITAQKRAEDELRLLQTIALTVGEETSDLRSTLEVVLRKICDATGWTLGEAWLPSADGEYLHFSGAAYTGIAELEDFTSHNHEFRYAPGEAMLGTVWQSKRPVWISDVGNASRNTPRGHLVRAAGLKAGLGVPVLAGESVVAVLSFFMLEACAEDQRLMSIVSGAAAQLGLLIQRKRAEARLNFLAHYDGLTGLPNRSLLTDRLTQTIIEAARHKRLVGVVCLDIDRFKNINDSLGHEIGDQLLKSVAERLTGTLRKGDTVARLSGDEYAVVLADMAQSDDAARLARKLVNIFAEPFHVCGSEIYVTVSLGVALFPNDDREASALLGNADIAMYRAKQAGGNCYQFYSVDMTTRASEALSLENDLRRAVERNELVLHYQPLVDATTAQVVAVEALVRWMHPKRGMIPPMQFIPLAEESGLIVPIGEWVLRSACRQCKRWRMNGHPKLRVAVNLSARQFAQDGLDGLVIGVLREVELEASALELELTESMIMHSSQEALAVMQRLADYGVTFSIDDFGTGYSNLSYLKRFPVDILKVDRSFVKDIPHNTDDTAIADAIITMAHSLGMHVVAEGVENEQQSSFLRTHGCDTMQGFYFSKPLPVDEADKMLRHERLPSVLKNLA